MESLEKQYMALLTVEEQQLLKLYLSNPQTVDKPFDLLQKKPYPILDILLMQQSNNYVYIKRTIIETFEYLLERAAKEGVTTNFLKFLIRLPEDIPNSLMQGWLQQHLKQCLNKSTLNNDFYLSLLACKNTHIIVDAFLGHLKETKWPYFSKEFVFHYALNSKTHFLNVLLKEKDVFSDIDDIVLRNNLIILKLAHELSKGDMPLEQLPNIENILKSLDLESIGEDLKSIHLYFYKDFKRLSVLIAYIRKYPNILSSLTVADVLSFHSPLVIIYKYKLLDTYDDAKSLIESYYDWQSYAPLLSVKEKELEVLCHYFVLTTISDIFTLRVHTTTEEMYSEKIQFLNNLLRQVKNFQSLCTILTDILKFVYLRWEHINRCRQAPNLNSSSSSSGLDDDDIVKEISLKLKQTKLNLKPPKTGFTCKAKSFTIVFNFLKMFVTKKFHTADFKQSTAITRLQFQNTMDTIGYLLRKYELFERLEQIQQQNQNKECKIAVDSEYLMNFVRFHSDSIEQESSDDDGNQKSKLHSWQSRRKSLKKRRRATISGGSVTADDARLSLRQSRLRTNTIEVMAQSTGEPFKRGSESKKVVLQLNQEKEEPQSIVPKLFSSPLKLAVVTLTLKQFHETKQIIENFGVDNSQLLQDLEYTEVQHYVKQKLSGIYDNFLQQERQTKNVNEPLATVEQIRNVVAKGFEVSKIISVIDYFAQVNPICQTESVKELINKHKSNPQYRFLSHFEESNLNAVKICDLIVSLPLNRDIITSVLMIIKRHQAIQSSMREQESAEKSQLPINIGPLNFLENLAECMRVMDGKSIKDLLSDNIYTLKPDQMALELHKEQIFRKVFFKNSRELSSCDHLKALIPQFQSLKSKYNHYQRFCNYIQQFAKLVRLRYSNCKYHLDELLKMDPYDVIGDLLFSCNMSPQEIETIVASLNLNLVHVVALNLCPEIMGTSSLKKRHLSAVKRTALFDYISNYNHLLVLLLQGIADAHIPKGTCKYLERLVNMPEIEKLSLLYGGNKVIAALRSDHVSVRMLSDIERKIDKFELIQCEIGIQGPKTLRSQLLDGIIIELIYTDAKNIYLASQISDIALRANFIYDNFTKIPTTRLAKELIEATLQHHQAVEKIPRTLRQKLEVTLADITIYAKVSEAMQFESWPQAYDFGLKTPTTIFQHLLQSHLYKLCYEWCNVVKLSSSFLPQRQQFMNILLEALRDMSDHKDDLPVLEQNSYRYLLQILESFPPEVCKGFLETNKDKFRSIVLVKYSIQYLDRFAKADVEDNLRNYKISILIIEQLSHGERKLFWNLIRHPLLIIEQLIMNAKFEALTKVLTSVRHELEILSSQATQLCSFCLDKKGFAYDIHKNAPNSPKDRRFQLGSNDDSTTSSAFIMLNFNLYQASHFITNECIDFLLRIYATKALDYQISDTCSSQPSSQSTNYMPSLDSLCDIFRMPPHAPARSSWVQDKDATHCMCCKIAAFTMLMRRHHCRRCGRVVCFACSTHRMRIPALYEDVEVRVCNDCHNLSQDYDQHTTERDCQTAESDNVEYKEWRLREDHYKWKLSGNITHDKLVREEFCYEHAPSVALCLSILDYHLGNQKCVDLLLFHCNKLFQLIIPNPEVDCELVAKMMNCLALAAKVRGAEVETIQEHYEVIMSVVQNGCEALIPTDHVIKKLADSLVKAEIWDLALEVHLKFFRSTAGVMAAHGLSCLRAGCYDTAREKFSHCMTKLTNEEINNTILKVILNPATTGCAKNDNVDSALGLRKDHDIAVIKRPLNGPTLLQEILKLIESLPFSKTQQETLQRASVIRKSNSSLVSLLSRRKETYVKQMHEPSLNILNTLANLKRISKGQYSISYSNPTQLPPLRRKELFCSTREFEECLYYVLTYGSHVDIVQFFMHHRNLVAALKYYLLQKLDADIFINHIYLEMLKSGKVSQLVKQLLEFDSHLLIWRTTLLQTCRYLETQNLLNSLYELQIKLNDPVRASMTCVKFYTMNCDTFQQQHLNAQHLHNARQHLQAELEVVPWTLINLNTNSQSTQSQINRRSSITSSTSSSSGGAFQLKIGGKSLNAHINTIEMQLDVAKFLSRCEIENNVGDKFITEKVLKEIRIESKKALPTLFDQTPEKIQICILILLCGKNIDEGFGLSYRIIQHFKLSPMKVYAGAAKYLAGNKRLLEIDKLINCITTNNGISKHEIDEILSVAINSAIKNNEPEVKLALNNFIKKIQSIELQISSHIFIGQLKSAYLLANKYERLGDIRKILRKAEETNQIHIKKLCEKKLQMSSDQSK